MPFIFRRLTWMIALGSVAVAAYGCSSNDAGPDGPTGLGGTGGATAGTTGMGGTAGTTGVGGTGGSGGGGPLCATPGDFSESCVFGAQSSAVTSTVSAAVTVISMDTIATGSCPTNFTAVVDPTRRLVLQGPAQQQWTVYLRIPELPTDLIRAGDALDLSVIPYNGGTTIVLARSGSAVAFASYYSGFMAPRLPDLSAFGIALSDGGVACASPAGTCLLMGHRVHVTAGAASGDVERGQTAHIGGLSISLERFDFVQCTDPSQGMEIAGFAIP